jgi:hypothetical protein
VEKHGPGFLTTEKRLSPGQPLPRDAHTWNRILAALEFVESWKRQTGGPVELSKSQTVAKVRNDTGDDLDPFSVVGLSAPVIGPTDNLAQFQSAPNFKAVKPATDSGRIAVLMEPVAAGAIGRAVVSGVVAVQVTVTSTGHEFATPSAGDTDKLASDLTGPARILSPPAATGLQWLYVLLQGGAALGTTGSAVARVRVESNTTYNLPSGAKVYSAVLVNDGGSGVDSVVGGPVYFRRGNFESARRGKTYLARKEGTATPSTRAATCLTFSIGGVGNGDFANCNNVNRDYRVCNVNANTYYYEQIFPAVSLGAGQLRATLVGPPGTAGGWELGVFTPYLGTDYGAFYKFAGNWDQASPLTVTLDHADTSCAGWPPTITLYPEGSGGSGSGSGSAPPERDYYVGDESCCTGGSGSGATVEEEAAAYLLGATPAYDEVTTITDTTIAAGSVLVAYLATEGPNFVGTGDPPIATFAGRAMALVAQAAGYELWAFAYVAAEETTGRVHIQLGSEYREIAVQLVEVAGVEDAAVRSFTTAQGTYSIPSLSGLSGGAGSAPAVVLAAFALVQDHDHGVTLGGVRFVPPFEMGTAGTFYTTSTTAAESAGFFVEGHAIVTDESAAYVAALVDVIGWSVTDWGGIALLIGRAP